MHWFLGDTWCHEIKHGVVVLCDVPSLAHMFMVITPGPVDWPSIFTNSLPICSGRENSFPAWNLAAASSLCLRHESPELSNKPVYTSRCNHCPSNHPVLFHVKPIICRFCLYSSLNPPPIFSSIIFFPLYLLDVLEDNEKLQKEAGMLRRGRKYLPAPKNGCLLLILGVSGKSLREPHQRMFGKNNWFPNEVQGHLLCVLISYKYNNIPYAL